MGTLALTEEETTLYYELPFNNWVQALRQDQFEGHHLPPETTRYGIADLPEIIERRRQLIAEHLREELSENQIS